MQCAGTCEATSVKADYRGIPSCAAAKLFYGGNGSCIFGCMGFGDCAKACPQGAISMQDGIACVDHTECIGCGICAQTCPQKIIEIVPDIIRTEVLCSSYHNGPYTRKVCSSGCIGCHKCEKDLSAGRHHRRQFPCPHRLEQVHRLRRVRQRRPTGAMVYGDFSGASRVQPFKRPAAHPENNRAAAGIPAAAFVSKTRRASVARGSKRMRNLVIPAGGV